MWVLSIFTVIFGWVEQMKEGLSVDSPLCVCNLERTWHRKLSEVLVHGWSIFLLHKDLIALVCY